MLHALCDGDSYKDSNKKPATITILVNLSRFVFGFVAVAVLA